MTTRRSFLRSLSTLPLIGGGVSIIGAPVKADVPITPQLLDSYDAWLHFERRWLKFNRLGPERYKSYGDFIPMDNRGAMYHFNAYGEPLPDPVSRAAVVLSAVGCDWNGREQ